MSHQPAVRTSDLKWFKQIKRLFDSRTNGVLVDDAKLGISAKHMTIPRLSEFAKRQAYDNPAAASLTGGVAAIIAILASLGLYEWLIGKRPPSARIKVPGIEIEWQFDDK